MNTLRTAGESARQSMVDAIRRELLGPGADAFEGKPVDCVKDTVLIDSFDNYRGLLHDSESGQEILHTTEPLDRYSIGILHGGEIKRDDSINDLSLKNVEDDLLGTSGLPTNDEIVSEPIIVPDSAQELSRDVADSDDFDLTHANAKKPSALALSFKVYVPDDVASIKIKIEGANYRKISAREKGSDKKPRTWWLRCPFSLEGDFYPGTFMEKLRSRHKIPVRVETRGEPPFLPQVEVFMRRDTEDPGSRLITLVIKNSQPNAGSEHSIFQTYFRVEPTNGLSIMSYPERHLSFEDSEQKSLSLLYRNKRTYAIGHGSAADWLIDDSGTCKWVSAEVLPTYEVESLTPDILIEDSNGEITNLRVSMNELADGSDSGSRQVEKLLEAYERWIEDQESSIDNLPNRLKGVAQLHIDRCRTALARMHRGWSIICSDSVANQAFRWANEAMYVQQQRSRLPLRKVTLVDGRQRVEKPLHISSSPRSYWRPFQIAFFLTTIPELFDKNDSNREHVDLIFFPTGGGKTEAYLGAAAFSIFSRRLKDPEDSGTDVLMRYTLRLLTSQQFLRAASLICAMEKIRAENSHSLGVSRISIGVWLGSSSTPNTWERAKEAWNDLKKGYANQFLLIRCPWCATEMGPVRTSSRRKDIQVVGYQRGRSTIKFQCPDQDCEFSKGEGLPVHVVDEDIYEVRPTLLIGTVDKFAMLAWTTKAHSIFGLSDDGERLLSPPNIILQDEMHLISGPLGSMVGLYEPIIEDLCTDYRWDSPTRPKIIAATATIRKYREQIQGLYGRESSSIFPPHGLEDGRSFFAEPAVREDGSKAPGRMYVGISSLSLGSMQSLQVRVMVAALQGAQELSEEDRDGYWTNLNFFNSLRELGNTLSLLQSDVPDYQVGLERRDGVKPRWPRNIRELTSRRSSHEIPKAITELEAQYGTRECLDISLASNIIEVGIDVSRLALMTIVGQPKTTAQYIQVSGRVGRNAEKAPGLILTVYGTNKPRDRSHYERFRTYHERLYAQVEPTSVTPFSMPVMDRALHAVLVAHVRQTNSESQPWPFPEDEFYKAAEIVKQRLNIVDPNEASNFMALLQKRMSQWKAWERTEWEANERRGSPEQGLMVFSGQNLNRPRPFWEVPTSMRNVDAQCLLEITQDYLLDDE